MPNLPNLADLRRISSELPGYKNWNAVLENWQALLTDAGVPRERRWPVMRITAAVVTMVCLLEIGNVGFLNNLELMTFDARVRLASHLAGSHPHIATNLGLVEITDDTVDTIGSGTLGYSSGLLWPRSIYGRALQELSRQGAGIVGLDVDFDSRRPSDPPVVMDGRTNASDQFFADALKQAGNAILAAERHVAPDALFQRNAADLGNVTSERDEDGVLRRDRPYEIYRIWDPTFKRIALEWHLDLEDVKVHFDSQDFTAGDITDLQSFAAKLRAGTDPASAFLSGRLDKEAAAALLQYKDSAAASNQLVPLLIRALNKIVAGPSIYKDARFAGVKLRPEVLWLFERNFEDGGTPRLNRLLLEDAYPMELARNEAAGITIARKHQMEAPLTYHRDKDGFAKMREITASAPADQPPLLPFTFIRVWSMGIVMAAADLKLDLDNPEIQLQHHRVILRGDKGVSRVISLEPDGTYYVNWELGRDNALIATNQVITNDPGTANQSVITNQIGLRLGYQAGSFEELLQEAQERSRGSPVDTGRWKNRLIVIGSAVTAFSAVEDQGNTALETRTILVLKHLNVANQMLTDRFVTTSGLGLRLALIVAMGLLAGWITSAVGRPMAGSGLMLGLVALYLGLACWLYVAHRFWLPVFLPLVCSGLVTHASALTYRVHAEQTEKKRVKSVFSKMLAPEVVNELLSASKFSVGGERREITVYFADIRGFTTLTELTQAKALDYVEKNKLTPEEAEAYHNRVARETLDTVSTYLGIIAAAIKKHNGTLDKYIGDCAMAFWGGPLANPTHASDAVRSAIEAQRAMLELNLKRHAENKRMAAESAARAAQGLPPETPLPLLSLGTGINTGPAIMGLMGSDADGLSYTVFGREVNLASRLEGLSGYGRIIISETTFLAVKREAPDLAALCVEQLPADLKGFLKAVKNYEVRWRPEGGPEDPTLTQMPAMSGTGTGTFMRRPG